MLSECFHRFFAGKDDVDLMAFEPEGVGQAVGEITIVVNDEDAQFAHVVTPSLDSG